MTTGRPDVDFPEVAVRRGGLAATGGWCAPSDTLSAVLAAPAPPVQPCDGVNHRWERIARMCTNCCVHGETPRRLECAACLAEVREGADGFDELWEAAPWE